MVPTTEGYYSWKDIVWNWAPKLDPIQRVAVSSVVHPNALLDPNHPLVLPGHDAIEFYITECIDGSRILCFSLKQIQYLQYYIHQMGLTNPEHPVNAAAVQADDYTPPSEYVPLPSGLLLAHFFTKVETVSFYTTKAMSQMEKKLRQLSKGITRQRIALGSSFDPSTQPPSSDSDPFSTANATLQNTAQQMINQVQGSNAIEEYFHHAQQAFQLAGVGGCSNLVEDNTDIDKAAGRSLFISLAVRIHPEQNDRLLDLGYSALCFSENPNDPTQFEEFREDGNWVVQQEIGFPFAPTSYQYGLTYPFSRATITSNIARKIKDLRTRAGAGPTYIIHHSTDLPTEDFELLNLDINSWGQFMDSSDDVPSYASPIATTKTYTIDTARLFAAVEYDQPGDESDIQGYTTRSLKEVVSICFPHVVSHLHSDNAGNTAAYAMEVFLHLIDHEGMGKPLVAVRDEFSSLLAPMTGVTEQEDTDPAPAPAEDYDTSYAAALVEDEDEYDSDFDDVAGVYICGEEEEYESDSDS